MASQLASLILTHKQDILKKWINNQLEDPALKDSLMSNEDLRTQSEELLDALAQAVQKGNFTDIEAPEYQALQEQLSAISLMRAHAGFTPRETMLFVLSLKRAIIQLLQEKIGQNLKEFTEEVLKVSGLIDSLSMVTTETYLKGREEVILRQTSEINEISTPVIRVWDGILALPIIGTLDSARTQVVMENLLQEIVNTGSGIAILDISGVPTVDSLVAQHLIKTVNATRLMGAECIISGIKPDIAQTIVHLGIDLAGIQTKSSLAAALRLAFAKLNLGVTKVAQLR